MQHVWLDRKGVRCPEEVTLYDIVQYKHEGFDNFLRGHQLDADLLSNQLISIAAAKLTGHDIGASEAYLNSIVQEWLFIGAALEFFRILGLHVSRSQFIHQCDSDTFLSTSALKSLVFRAFSDASTATAYSEANAADQIVYERMLWSLCKNEAELGRGLWQVDSRASIESQMLHLIGNVRTFMTQNTPETTCLDPATWCACCVLSDTFENILSPVTLWPSRCRDLQLCPSRLRALYSGSSFTEGFIASSLLPEQTLDHSGCHDGQSCSADNNFQPCPSHRRACSGPCLMRSLNEIDTELLHEIVKAGFWGIIVFANDDPLCPDFSIESSGIRPTSYVAVSHVWSHGLGNPHANAIWTCQLLYLKQLLVKMGYRHRAIWLDPICVPLHTELKSIAVAQMQHIYTQADATLVLDHNLENQSGSLSHKVLHILASDWMTRLWILQEALLPGDKLRFAFADGIFNVDDLVQHPRAIENFELSSALIMTRWHVELRSILQRAPAEHKLLNMLKSFSQRKLTNLEDEPICLAILCDVAVERLPRRPQLHHVFEHFSEIPQDIAFAGGPRTVASGFGWLPKSLVNANHYKPYLPRQMVVPRSERGLRLTKDLARFHGTIWHQPIDKRTLKLSHYALYAASDSREPYRIMVIKDHSSGIEEQARPRHLRNAGLVFEKSRTSNVSSAILVDHLIQSEDGAWDARYISQMWTVLLDQFKGAMPYENHTTMPKVLAPLTVDTDIWIG